MLIIHIVAPLHVKVVIWFDEKVILSEHSHYSKVMHRRDNSPLLPFQLLKCL